MLRIDRLYTCKQSDILYMTTLDTGRCSHLATLVLVGNLTIFEWRSSLLNQESPSPCAGFARLINNFGGSLEVRKCSMGLEVLYKGLRCHIQLRTAT